MADFLARSVSAAKWLSRTNIAPDEIPADGVGDLRTSNNELSFWLYDTGVQGSLEDIVLVLASNRQRVDVLDLVWLPVEDIAGMRIRVRSMPGQTPVTSLNHRHRDLTGIDLSRLFRLAEGVAQAAAGERIRRFTKRQVADILVQAVQRGLVEAQSLNESIRADVRKAAAERNDRGT